MIEGMPASNSTAAAIGVRSHEGATSVRKMATPKLTGTAMIMAMSELTSVP
jgi:hypothetical protein